MGCSSAREKIEVQMLMLQMRKKEIHNERQDKITKLMKLTGSPVERKPVKDYLVIPNPKVNKQIIKLAKIKKAKSSHKDTITDDNDNNKITRNKSMNMNKTDNKSTCDVTYKNKHKKVTLTCGEEVEEEEEEEKEEDGRIEEKESEENEDSEDNDDNIGVGEKEVCSLSEDNNNNYNEENSSEIIDDHLCYYYQNKKYYFEELNN